MIDGITTYGSTELTEKLQEVEDEAVFLLTIGTTETSLIHLQVMPNLWFWEK